MKAAEANALKKHWRPSD